MVTITNLLKLDLTLYYTQQQYHQLLDFYFELTDPATLLQLLTSLQQQLKLEENENTRSVGQRYLLYYVVDKLNVSISNDATKETELRSLLNNELASNHSKLFTPHFLQAVVWHTKQANLDDNLHLEVLDAVKSTILGAEYCVRLLEYFTTGELVSIITARVNERKNYHDKLQKNNVFKVSIKQFDDDTKKLFLTMLLSPEHGPSMLESLDQLFKKTNDQNGLLYGLSLDGVELLDVYQKIIFSWSDISTHDAAKKILLLIMQSNLVNLQQMDITSKITCFNLILTCPQFAHEVRYFKVEFWETLFFDPSGISVLNYVFSNHRMAFKNALQRLFLRSQNGKMIFNDHFRTILRHINTWGSMQIQEFLTLIVNSEIADSEAILEWLLDCMEEAHLKHIAVQLFYLLEPSANIRSSNSFARLMHILIWDLQHEVFDESLLQLHPLIVECVVKNWQQLALAWSDKPAFVGDFLQVPLFVNHRQLQGGVEFVLQQGYEMALLSSVNLQEVIAKLHAKLSSVLRQQDFSNAMRLKDARFKMMHAIPVYLKISQGSRGDVPFSAEEAHAYASLVGSYISFFVDPSILDARNRLFSSLSLWFTANNLSLSMSLERELFAKPAWYAAALMLTPNDVLSLPQCEAIKKRAVMRALDASVSDHTFAAALGQIYFDSRYSLEDKEALTQLLSTQTGLSSTKHAAVIALRNGCVDQRFKLKPIPEQLLWYTVFVLTAGFFAIGIVYYVFMRKSPHNNLTMVEPQLDEVDTLLQQIALVNKVVMTQVSDTPAIPVSELPSSEVSSGALPSAKLLPEVKEFTVEKLPPVAVPEEPVPTAVSSRKFTPY